jgi:transposase-like protein
VDGCWVKIADPSGEVSTDALGRRRAVKRKQKRVVFTALGVWPDGHWEIVSWKIAPQEDAEAWNAFVGELYVKGLTEETTEWVVSDGTQGLPHALERHLPCVPHQRCLCHKIKNIADSLRYTDLVLDPTFPPAEAVRWAKRARKKAIVADAGQVYRSDVTTAIRNRAEGFRATWEQREPQAVGNFFVDFEQTLSSLTVDFPRAFVSLIRTTNLLERFHKEIRRKQRDIGMFQSERGCEAVWYLIATRETAQQQAALGCKR